jgi:hypothetical protein
MVTARSADGGEHMATAQKIERGRSSEIAILARLLKVDEGTMPRALARYILTLGFDEEDQARMRDLAERNQVAALSPDEREELRSYVTAGHLLALLHSKARRSLRPRKVS